MSESANIADTEFASAMQQLSAEARKVLKPEIKEAGENVAEDSGAQVADEFRALRDQVGKIEIALAKRIDALADATLKNQAADQNEQLRKIEEQLNAIRKTESVNQKLFDSLHKELHGYRDNFLHESLQKPFIRDLILLFDDLSAIAGQLSGANPSEARKQPVGVWCDNLHNAVHSLLEILHRMEVKEVETRDKVDLAVHKVVSSEPAEFPEEDGNIVQRVKRGFFWRDQLLRPEEVIAKRFG